MSSIGLFAWIRKTKFTFFLFYWVLGIFAFTFIYFLLSLIGVNIGANLSVGSNAVDFTFPGFIESLYSSLLISTIFGFFTVTASGIYIPLIYLQFTSSLVIVLIVLDKMLQKYVFPIYHLHHNKDKKINTMTVTMSIFRNDISRLKAEFKAKTKRHVNIKDIELIIDGLYVTFLDIDRMFSVKNIHRKHISDTQHMTILINIEDSIHTLYKFIDFLEDHKIEWHDKHIDFWINYILDVAEKITTHFDDSKTKGHKVIIAVENIRYNVELIRKKV